MFGRVGSTYTGSFGADEGKTAYDLLTTLCGLTTDLVYAIEGLVFPALMAVTMAMYCWYCMVGTCCATGCCKKPVTGKVTPKEGSYDAQIQA